jgi:hypothetical protein
LHAGSVLNLAWSPEGRFLASSAGSVVRFCDGRTLQPHGQVLFLVGEKAQHWLAVGPEGHFRTSDPKLELVYVVQTERGQETLSPAEMEDRFGWKNDPDKVRLLRP